MPKFKVFAKTYEFVEVEVTAKDFDSAVEKAECIDGGDWKRVEMSDGFDITHVQNVETEEEKAVI